jgi:hypothetical protein
VPDLGDERQCKHYRGADRVKRCEEGPPGKSVDVRGGQRGDHDVHHHLDRQSGPEYRPRVAAGEFVGEKPERDGG